MSSEFDPSPRSSKRRKTTRYGTQRTILSEDVPQGENASTSTGQVNQPNSITQKSRASVRNLTNGSNDERSPAQEDDRPADSVAEDIDEQELNVTPSKVPRQPNGTKAHRRSTLNGDNARGDQKNTDGESAERREENGHTNNSAEDDDTPKVRSSGRQRKKPNRFAENADEIPLLEPTSMATVVQPESPEKSIASPVIKGILTPSRKQKAPRPRKSVMFDQDEAAIGEQFGFKDIDTPAKTVAKKSVEKRTPRRTALIAREALLENPEIEHDLQNEDEILGDVLIEEPQIDVVIPEVTVDEAVTTTAVSEDNIYIHGIKSQILSRLTSASLPRSPPPHLESQYNQLYNLLQSTIVSSESNSLLLLGPRGAGKSTLLSLALRALTSEHSSDFHTVHLNGFLQTDDRLALREIWRQLGREMQVDETETEDVAGSYADTMVSLLSLLSHPDEMQVDDQFGTEDVETLASNAMQIAGGGQRTSKSIVFILDEFELFTNHPRQTLLYNLFDIAQSRKAPIAVIGCSTRMDVIECLEKRVKSRFSHRWLLVPNCKTFSEWEVLVKETLLAESPAKFSSESKEEVIWKAAWNEHIKTIILPSEKIQSLLKSHFYTTKSLPDLFTALYPIIATLTLPSISNPITQPPSNTISTNSPDILTLLPTLPTLHTTLLISTSRLHTIHHLPSTNFNLIYTHYTELIAQSRLRQSASGNVAVSGSLRAWGRETCRGAWEDLGRWGVVTPVVGGRDDSDGDGDGWETRMWRCEVTLEDLSWGVKEKGKEGVGGDSGVLERWCREV